jgi:hypothetical protein
MMKARAVLLAAALVQCTGTAPPAPSPAASSRPAPAAASGSGPGPVVGAAVPAFEAPDQDGQTRTFDTLRGPNGLLLNFNRSVLW